MYARAGEGVERVRETYAGHDRTHFDDEVRVVRVSLMEWSSFRSVKVDLGLG